MGEPSSAFVVAMGISIVFISLICIILICKIMGWLCNINAGKEKEEVTEKAVNSEPAVIANKQEIIAAVSAAVAEELGTDISAIRVLSFKKI